MWTHLAGLDLADHIAGDERRLDAGVGRHPALLLRRQLVIARQPRRRLSTANPQQRRVPGLPAGKKRLDPISKDICQGPPHLAFRH